MITSPTSCFYMIKAEGEAAASMLVDLVPGCASDIDAVILLSSDFDSDISAINSLDATVKHIKDQTYLVDAEVKEEYNPLYFQSDMQKIDDAMMLDASTEGFRFTAMRGNAYALKTVEVMDGDTLLISAKIEYRPFDFPAYSEIVASNQTLLN